MKPDPAIVDKWSGVAPFWEKYRAIIQQMFAPVTSALIEDAGIGSGYAVLDVATGPGEPALTIAAWVSAQGNVVGVDLAPQMVAVAGRAAGQRGLRNTRFEVASADELPFPETTFDAVVSRFGAMFFPSPVDAVREMLRVLRPGRRLALAVWGLEESNPFFEVLSRVVNGYTNYQPQSPGDQDPFRFASPGGLQVVLGDAGALQTSDRLLEFTIHAPISAEDFWTLRCEMSERLRERVAMLSNGQLTELKHLAIDALREYSTEDGMKFPAQVRIVAGTK